MNNRDNQRETDSMSTETAAYQLTEIINTDALPQDASLVHFEIQNIREAITESNRNVADVQKKLQEEQMLTQEKKVTKSNLEKETAELKWHLDNEMFQKTMINKQIEKMRKLLKDMSDASGRSDRSLEVCSTDKQKAAMAIKKQNTKISENLTKMEEVLKNTESEVRTMEETLLSQHEIYRDDIKECENKQLMLQEKLKNSKSDLEILITHSDELSERNKTCLSKITEVGQQNELLENELQKKQNRLDELVKEMEQHQQDFELSYEEVSRDLDDTSYAIQKKEGEIISLERAIKNQKTYNKDLEEKLKVQENRNNYLQDQNEQLKNLQNEKQTESSENEKQLQEKIASKLAEMTHAESVCAREHEILAETVQALAAATKISKEVGQHVDEHQAVILEMQAKQGILSQNLAASEEGMSAMISNEKTASEELGTWKAKLKTRELEMSELVANKNSELSTLLAEIEKLKNDNQETTKAIFQEMNAIKIDFDSKTAEQTADYEQKAKQIEDEVQIIEKENQAVLMLQVTQDEELKKLNEECDNLKHKIKNFRNLNNILASFSALDEQIQTPSVSTAQAKTLRAPQMSFPLPGPKKERAFDELSGSSAEGHCATYQQLAEFNREKQRRRQIREQRRLQVKKHNSENNSK